MKLAGTGRAGFIRIDQRTNEDPVTSHTTEAAQTAPLVR